MKTVDQLLQGMRSLLNRCDLSSTTSLCLQHEPCSAIFISVTRGRQCRRGHRKTRFLFGSTSPYVGVCNFITLFNLELGSLLTIASFSFLIVGFRRCSSLTTFVHPYRRFHIRRRHLGCGANTQNLQLMYGKNRDF